MTPTFFSRYGYNCSDVPDTPKCRSILHSGPDQENAQFKFNSEPFARSLLCEQVRSPMHCTTGFSSLSSSNSLGMAPGVSCDAIRAEAQAYGPLRVQKVLSGISATVLPNVCTRGIFCAGRAQLAVKHELPAFFLRSIYNSRTNYSRLLAPVQRHWRP